MVFILFCASLQESRLAKNEAARMAALVEAEKECNLELSEKLKGVTKEREDVPGDRVKSDQSYVSNFSVLLR